MSTEATTAFSAQASAFDRIDAANPLIAWVRDRVRIQALATMRPGDTLLELNAGTGIDSCFFAAQGMQVLATDAAPGMIEQLRLKQAAEPKLPLDVMHCSFLDLERLGDRRFHHVFSNFGGLNCTAHLDEVLRGIDRVLLPNGTCTLVIMPRFSPWELGAALNGNFKLARRRWRRGGAEAVVEGHDFTCHYYGPAHVRRHLGPGYRVIAQRALSFFVPPPHQLDFMKKRPRIFRSLERIEDRLAGWPIIRNCGDHFVITLRKMP